MVEETMVEETMGEQTMGEQNARTQRGLDRRHPRNCWTLSNASPLLTASGRNGRRSSNGGARMNWMC